jgi:hypothetical protein
MDGGREPRGTFSPVALTGARPPIGRWLAVAGIALVLVVAKPWQTDEGGSGGSGTGAGAPVAGAPVATNPLAERSPSSSANAAEQAVAAFCLRPGSWLVASVERWRDQRIRVWRALAPANSARGPDDPSIPIVPVISEGLTELGWCAPVSGPESPSAPVTVTVWLRGTGGATLIALNLSQPAGDPSAFGALYRLPGPDAGSTAVPWLPGTYVFRYRESDGRERWFAIAVEIRPRLSPTP